MSCPFCHNSELIHNPPQLMDNEEVVKYLTERKKLLDGVVVTGGEPSIQYITPLLESLRSMGYKIKIDTNGLRPESIKEWLDKGLVDYIAMDIKNSAEKYSKTANMFHTDMEKIKKSINLIMNSNIDYEFRTTVVVPLHEPKDFELIGKELINNADKFYLQPFVMRDTVPDKSLKEPTDEMLSECLEKIKPYVKKAEIRGRDI